MGVHGFIGVRTWAWWAARAEERQEFLRLRRRANQETDLVYPRLPCTLSPGDLWPPETAPTP